MKYRIEERDGIRFVGRKYFISGEGGKDFTVVPSFWENLPKETYTELESLSDCIPDGVVGLFAKKHDNGFDYWIAAATTKPCPEHYEVVEFPAAKWIVFEAKGPLPGSIQETFMQVYSEFFVNSTVYARRQEVYEIEWFSKGDTSSDSYISEAWVPVVQK